ncbi:MAG: hypothetical protein KJ692_02595 [Verrucomicrobia bacterium]|nr:hypothetical protein [Verrucomicrobiota bacterium]
MLTRKVRRSWRLVDLLHRSRMFSRTVCYKDVALPFRYGTIPACLFCVVFTSEARPEFSFRPVLAVNRSLSVQVEIIQGSPAFIRGADSRCPRAPFTFDWDDGTKDTRFFPAQHAYHDTNRNYTVSITGHYDDGSRDTTVAVRVSLRPIDWSCRRSAAVKRCITIPSAPTEIGTTMPGYLPPNGTQVFDQNELDATRRGTIEYVMDVAHQLQLNYCNGNTCPDAMHRQVILKQTALNGCMAQWFSHPPSITCYPDYLGKSIIFSSLFHELGHNITLNTPRRDRLGGKIDGPMNAVFSEALANIFQHATVFDILNTPGNFELSDDILAMIRESGETSAVFVTRGYHALREGHAQVATYNDPQTSADETFDTFMTVAYVFMALAEERKDYGRPLARTMRVIQTFGPEDHTRYQNRSNEAFRTTFWVAALSYGFNIDLQARFRQLGFSVDERCYKELMARVGP